MQKTIYCVLKLIVTAYLIRKFVAFSIVITSINMYPDSQGNDCKNRNNNIFIIESDDKILK